MKVKRIIGIAVALVFMLSVFPKAPLSVKAETNWTVPDGYSEYEYNKLAEFLETEDEDGVKNGEKLYPSYDVNDPSTWNNGWLFCPIDDFYDDGYYHVIDISWDGSELESPLVGELDISGFTYLAFLIIENNDITSVDASNCPKLADVQCDIGSMHYLNLANDVSLDCLICNDLALDTLIVTGCSNLNQVECYNTPSAPFCGTNHFTSLDFSTCTSLTAIHCSNTGLCELNISGCTELTTLDAENNNLTSIDLSCSDAFTCLNLSNNKLKGFDVSHCSALRSNIVERMGNGYVGCFDYPQRTILTAVPKYDEQFIGWFNSDDELLSEDASYEITDTYETLTTVVYARFTENHLLGDADCNDVVNIADALATMRHSMGIIALTEQGLLNADFDEKNGVNTVDALAIMRYALLHSN